MNIAIYVTFYFSEMYQNRNIYVYDTVLNYMKYNICMKMICLLFLTPVIEINETFLSEILLQHCTIAHEMYTYFVVFR